MALNKINETHQLGPMSSFFLIQVTQIGIGFFSFQQPLSRFSAQDAWVACLIGGLSSLGVMWLILRLLENEHKYGRADLFSIHTRIFGKWIGGVLNLATIIFFMLYAAIYLRSYIEILQVWIFPQLSILVFTALFCLLIAYIVLGGMRTIGGIFLLSFVYMIPLYAETVFAVPGAHFSNLLPLFDHGPKSLLLSVFYSIHIYLGSEMILFYYPFIKHPEQAKKWCYFALLDTLFIYLMIMILGTAYFSQGEMKLTIWPTVTFWKSITFPLFEHVDMINIVYMIWILLPSMALSAWIVSRGIKLTFPVIRQKYALIFVLAVFIVVAEIVYNGELVATANALFSKLGFCFNYIYIPLLLLCQWIVKKVKGEPA
ncbi:GerAB/ArcD/ProY family transporter [Sporolactobacillus vineae]|uniref:GerAB/ArcD/ProY family transporter n=1 Tax=Sporolactobacillus vineae TaxID=444463 RepID=UPI000289F7AC|nr:GerAB/ArcD/ProY family transporter [Sporolactobacillus vineae]